MLTPCKFVTLLASPRYLQHLAAGKYFDNPAFIAYLDYLQYWSRPEYAAHLQYPAPSLEALRLLQVEGFRRDILGTDVVEWLGQRLRTRAVERGREGG